jgi:hypothetical protein
LVSRQHPKTKQKAGDNSNAMKVKNAAIFNPIFEAFFRTCRLFSDMDMRFAQDVIN